MICYFGLEYIFCIANGAFRVRIVLAWARNEGIVTLNVDLAGGVVEAKESARKDWNGVLPNRGSEVSFLTKGTDALTC